MLFCGFCLIVLYFTGQTIPLQLCQIGKYLLVITVMFGTKIGRMSRRLPDLE